MATIQLFVTGSEVIDNMEYLVGELLSSFDESANAETDYVKPLFAASQGGRLALGCAKLHCALFEGAGLRWRLENVMAELPVFPYVLTNNESDTICYDGIVKFSPSDIFLHRTSGLSWSAFGVRLDEWVGVIRPVNGRSLGYNRLTMLGKSGDDLPTNAVLTDIDDDSEVLGAVRLQADY